MTELITRPLDPIKDGQDLIHLFELVFGETVLPYMWQWKYVPPWAKRYYCWVGSLEDKTIGYAGAVPLRGQIDGKETPFFQLADFMVHPDHRRQFDFFDVGARAILDDISATHPDDHLLYGFSNHRAFLWFKKLGLSDLVEKAMARFVHVRPTRAADRFTFEDWAFDDPRIDATWARLGKRHRISLIRDGKYLNWRYAGHPVNNYRLIGVLDAGEAVGWILVGNDGAGQQGRPPEVPIVDTLLPDDCYRTAFEELVGYLDNAVMAWLPQHLATDFPEQNETSTNVFHFTNGSAVDTQFLRNHLYYTMGDVDWW